MRILLDTQIILWRSADASDMPIAARAIIEENRDEIFVSRVSLWEMAIKVGTGKLRVDLAAFAKQVEKDGFTWLPIENKHLLSLAELPSYADHKDPFDRLLVAQSLSEPAILITTDKKLARYGQTVRIVDRNGPLAK